MSNLDEFFYKVVQILALVHGVSMLFMVRESLFPFSSGQINFDWLWSFEFEQLSN